MTNDPVARRRRHTLFLAGLVSIALGVVWAGSSAPASQAAPAAVLCVDPPGGFCPYHKIQDAINAAMPDDSILITPGTFTENLTISKTLTIIGQVQPIAAPLISPSPTTVIDGGGKGRVIEVQPAVALTLTGVWVQNGVLGNTGSDQGRGGGIRVDSGARLWLSNSTVYSNTAYHGGGMIAEADSVVSIDSGFFEANVASFGGGLNNGGNVLIQRSGFANNQAAEGGALYNYASPSIMNVQGTGFYFNQAITTSIDGPAQFWGGAINNLGDLQVTGSSLIDNNSFGSGGGLANRWAGTATLLNTTVASNTAYLRGGGIFVTDSPQGIPQTELEWTTIAYNRANLADFPWPTGGGIFGSLATTSAANGVLLAKNTRGSAGQTADDCAATLESTGYNLIQNTSGCTIGNDNATNLKGVDPRLSPKLDFIAPVLYVMSLLPGSPAIDAGGTVCPAADERGTERPVNHRCDIGAFEAAYQFLPVIVQ